MFFCVIGDPLLAAELDHEHHVVEASPGLSVQMLIAKIIRAGGRNLDQTQVIVGGDIDAAQRLAFALLKMQTFKRPLLLLTDTAPTGEVANSCLHVTPAEDVTGTFAAVCEALALPAPGGVPAGCRRHKTWSSSRSDPGPDLLLQPAPPRPTGGCPRLLQPRCTRTRSHSPPLSRAAPERGATARR